MAKVTSIINDHRYKDFILRYAFDIEKFSIEVCGRTPTAQQIELFESVEPFGSRTSVSSGHGSGKSSGAAIITMWHLLCYTFSNTILTAPKLETLRTGIWKELSDLKSSIMSGHQAWVSDYFELETEKLYIKGHKMNWWAVCRTAPRGSPENLAGQHREHLLWFADEASGIPDANFGTIGGSLTDARNRFVIVSQPTRPSGYFYETHNELSTTNGGVWNALIFNSEESSLVSDQFILEKIQEYGGRDNYEYQIKVLGMFPENNDKYLLGRKIIEDRINAASIISNDEYYGNVIIVDVAAGVHRDKTIATHAKIIGNGDRTEIDSRRVEILKVPLFSNALDWTPMARIIVDYAATISNPTIIVDTNGMGIQFAKKLEEFGASNVIYSRWGDKPFKKKYKDRFFNLRAQCAVHAAEAIKDGRLILCDDYKKELLDQGSRIPFFIDEKGLWHIAKKEDMAKEGLPSPDYWDTVCMAFLENCTYIVSEQALIGAATIQHNVLQAAQDAFADIT